MSALNRSILEAALHGLEAQRERLEEHISTVRRMMRGSSGTGRGPGRPRSVDVEPESEPATPPARKKRRFSAAVRKRLADAMRQRWAVKRTAAQAAAKKRPATKKRAPARKSSAGKKRLTSSRVFGRKTLNTPTASKRPGVKKAAGGATAAPATEVAS